MCVSKKIDSICLLPPASSGLSGHRDGHSDNRNETGRKSIASVGQLQFMVNVSSDDDDEDVQVNRERERLANK